MGNPFFQTIADTVSGFVGDVADAWGGGSKKPGECSVYLSYPNSLGNTADEAFVFNSDTNEDFGNTLQGIGDLSKYADARANDGGTQPDDPFIMFEFFRLVPPTAVADDIQRTTEAISALNADNNLNNRQAFRGTNKATAAERERIRQIRDAEGKVKSTLKKRLDILKDQVGKRSLNNTVVLYMTPGITINDTINYDQESRKLAAVYDQVSEKGLSSLSGDDALVVGTQVTGAAVGYLGTFLEKIPMLGSVAKVVGGAGGLVTGQAVGDEVLRRSGKAVNPNEYMQFKNTSLRSFSFQWKFLPDTIQESLDCEEIIRVFRAAAHAHRNSAVTLSVPDQVIASFHGASGFPAFPATVISSVSVVYNPNSASFFKHNNDPVEVDFSITLSEIMPIYRDDVENKGY
jgi:hypothetical protein